MKTQNNLLFGIQKLKLTLIMFLKKEEQKKMKDLFY